MRTDVVIQFPNNDVEDVEFGFRIFVLFFTDDGYIYAARAKSFNEKFSASDLDLYLMDWREWELVAEEELEVIRTVCKGKSR